MAALQARGCPSKALGRVTSRPRALTVRVQASSSGFGSKVEQWLKTPFDLLTFGPRAGVGALVSLPDRLQTLNVDVEKMQELMQDPRPLDEKAAVLGAEAEDTLVQFLQRGADVEREVLSQVKSALPADLAQQLENIIPTPPTPETVDIYASEYPGEAAPPAIVYTADSVVESQIASEVQEVRNAVGGVKAALEELRGNTDPARASMLRLNLREARNVLSRRLEEAAPPSAAIAGGASEASLASATREAQVLLNEVDAQFGF